MATNTTTTTTTTPDGQSTIQKVEAEVQSFWDSEEAKFHETVTNWLSHVQAVAKSSAFVSAAYAAFEFARHLI